MHAREVLDPLQVGKDGPDILRGAFVSAAGRDQLGPGVDDDHSHAIDSQFPKGLGDLGNGRQDLRGIGCRAQSTDAGNYCNCERLSNAPVGDGRL